MSTFIKSFGVTPARGCESSTPALFTPTSVIGSYVSSVPVIPVSTQPIVYTQPIVHTTIYETVMKAACPSSTWDHTYTVTETVTNDPEPNTITAQAPPFVPTPTVPQGFTVSTVQCSVCDPTNVVVTCPQGQTTVEHPAEVTGYAPSVVATSIYQDDDETEAITTAITATAEETTLFPYSPMPVSTPAPSPVAGYSPPPSPIWATPSMITASSPPHVNYTFGTPTHPIIVGSGGSTVASKSPGCIAVVSALVLIAGQFLVA